MAGKGGGAWKVAYADFVTAMMAFFMVMWLIAQSDKVKQAVAKSFRNERGRYAPGDMLLPPRHEQYFKDRRPTTEVGESPASVDAAAHSARKPLTLAINNGTRTAVGTVVVFAAQSTELDPAAVAAMEMLLPSVLGKPQKIEIRGHATRLHDPANGSTATTADPWAVSFARCVATSKFLVEKGVQPDRIRLSQAGASEPYSIRQGSEVDTVEDRVEIFLLGETADDAFGTRDILRQRFKSPDSPNAGE